VRESPRAQRLRITVRPDAPPELVVPSGTTRPEIDRMLRANRDWIARKSAELAAREANRPQLGLDRPGVVWVHGQPVEVIRRPGSRSVARLTRGRLLVAGPRSEATGAIERWYRREAKARISQVVAREGTALGVEPGPVSVRDQRTRWGSCSPTGTLSFSWRLLLAPYEVLDYVVVHELCHLRELNHSRRFWGLVAEARPDWRTQSGWLRVHGAQIGAYTTEHTASRTFRD